VPSSLDYDWVGSTTVLMIGVKYGAVIGY